MPSISKIRFTNVVYEDGLKRYNDEVFKFDGYNGAILLENGGGKTVFIQTALQAIIPHTNLSDRKIKQTLQLDNYPAHIAIEWILSENPRRYLVTCVSLFLTKDGLSSYRYVYSYQAGDRHSIENIPFVRKDTNRPSDRGEISDYYQQMAQQFMNAQTFSTIKEFQHHIEEQYHIIANEWESIVKINSTEGGVEAFFDDCKQTSQLFDRLLIPTVEDAIAGHDYNTFADTFEKHRSSFKLYKELKEQIEENKAIEEELNRYVLTYEGLYAQQQAYEQKKQRAKSVLNLIYSQEQEHSEAIESIQLKIKDSEIEERQHRKKKLSLDIHKEQLEFNAIQNEFNEHSNQLEIAKEDLAYAIRSFYSFKYAELKKENKEVQDRIYFLKNQLETLDQNQDVHEIKDRLEENSQELIGYFLHEIEESTKRKHGLKIEKQPIVEQINQFAIQLKFHAEQLDQTKTSYEKNNGKMEQLNQHMLRIQKKILSNPDQESVKESVQKWEKRLVDLDDQIVLLKTDNKQLAVMIADSKKLIETIGKEKEENENKRIKLQVEIEQVDHAHSKIKEGLGTLRIQWAAVESIYLKQDSLTQQIAETILRLMKERDHLLYKERIAHRFMDDYGNQDLFFADPYLEKQLKQWSNQFHLLETGIQFIQSLEGDVKDQLKNYSLWPITLITTETEREQLNLKIQNIDKELQFPIQVITIEQARAIVQGESHDNLFKTPSHWSQNQNSSFFQEWKETMKTRAAEATSNRMEVEDRIDSWKHGAERLASFLQDYPYGEYQERKDCLSDLVRLIQELNTKQKDIQSKLSEYEEKLSVQREKIDGYSQEYNGLQVIVADAYEYLRLEKDYLDLKNSQEQFVKQIEEFERSMKIYEQQISKLEDVKRQIEDRERDENNHYSTLIDDELYLEVKTFQPIYTNKTKNI